MDYLLFTYPNCRKCEDLKAYLRDQGVPAEVFDVVEKDGRTRIRAFLPHVRRDEKGSIILPTLLCREDGRVAAVHNDREEFAAWLRSRG
ncbi:MAG: glutaredoxin [Candidatus Aminicenantes bacterium]|nr:glutaredoxin [Candidatus Aminicenantes bacterium]